MVRILTGVQSTGTPHLGNLLGAVFPAIELSKEEISLSSSNKIHLLTGKETISGFSALPFSE